MWSILKCLKTGTVCGLWKVSDGMFDKHYKDEGLFRGYNKLDKVVSVRLSVEELEILEKFYPGKSVSFAIRSAIHELECSRM